MKKKKVLVIVGHPDDEIIWMGGTLIRNRDKWDTTIISLCRKEDRDRAPKFFKVCEILNVKGFISDLEDDELNEIPLSDITDRIKGFIQEKEYNYVFTHGENGEYGHKRHTDTHRAIKQMLKDKSLKSKKVFFFAYVQKSAENTDTGFDCYVDKTADKFINLNQIEFLRKKEIMKMIYGYPENGFEERNSRDKEAFSLA
jgi:LmbE family N-acetylglucosaminyl deacetylase